jgi:hypothetical protein
VQALYSILQNHIARNENGPYTTGRQAACAAFLREMRVSSNKRRRPAAFCTGGAAGSEGEALMQKGHQVCPYSNLITKAHEVKLTVA